MPQPQGDDHFLDATRPDEINEMEELVGALGDSWIGETSVAVRTLASALLLIYRRLGKLERQFCREE